MALSVVSDAWDAMFYARAALERRGPVLLLGCSTGRVALHLASHGVPVVGVDPSRRLLAQTESRRRQLGLGRGSFRGLANDLRTLRLGKRFETVLAPQNALCPYLDDLEAVLASARRHLVAGGRLWFDVAVAAPGASTNPAPAPPHWFQASRGRSKKGRAVRRFRPPRVDVRTLEDALARAGFVLRARYGDFAGKPFTSTDPVLVAAAELS